MGRKRARPAKDARHRPGAGPRTGDPTVAPWTSLGRRLFAPVDIAPLVYFRVVFAAVMVWEVARYFINGWIDAYYVAPRFYFPFSGFEWVKPWPGHGMYVHFAALGGLALAVGFGCYYRVAAALFFVGITHVLLLDQTHYLNHHYLICLMSLTLVFVPAHHALSIDALRRPEIRTDTAPTWALWLLRAQVGIPYVYGGVAKLNADWLRGEPMRFWLPGRADFPVIGSLFTREWMPLVFSYGGLFFDLLVVPLLLWRRTRLVALAAAVLFHLTNARLFRIGIFPWFMIAVTLLYLPPHWFRLGGLWKPSGAAKAPEPAHVGPLSPGRRAALALLGVYLAAQLLVPFRHYVYPGNVAWTEEGYYFSWHMMLRDKRGTLELYATDPATGRTVKIALGRYFTSLQLRRMAINPDMVLQAAHYIARDLRQRGGYAQIEVRARVRASLNARPPQWLVDPAVDLAAQPRPWGHAPWIVALRDDRLPGQDVSPSTGSPPSRPGAPEAID